MPPKKKQPFMCFIDHVRGDSANRGRNLQDLIAEYGEVWKTMTAEQKRPFLENSQSAANECRRILTTLRTDALKEEEAEMEERLYRDYLEKLTEYSVFRIEDVEELMNKSFYICSFNVMCRLQNGSKWLANEVGLVEFSMKSGIINYYHEFIDPGDVPMGYARMAKEHSESSHQIPWVDFVHARGNVKSDDGSRDIEGRKRIFQDMVLEIVEMLKKTRLDVKIANKDPMMVFCQREQESQIRGCFKFLCEESEDFHDMHQQIEVLDVSMLLAHLAERINQPRPLAICEGDLNKSTFDYSANTNCTFHEEKDNRYCALGVARRTCYLLSDVLCQLYNIEPTSKHLPEAQSADFRVEQYLPNASRFNYRPKRVASENDETKLQERQEPEIRPPHNLPQMRGENRRDPRITSGGIGRGIRRPQN